MSAPAQSQNASVVAIQEQSNWSQGVTDQVIAYGHANLTDLSVKIHVSSLCLPVELELTLITQPALNAR
jgi:hypothetical protein